MERHLNRQFDLVAAVRRRLALSSTSSGGPISCPIPGWLYLDPTQAPRQGSRLTTLHGAAPSPHIPCHTHQPSPPFSPTLPSLPLGPRPLLHTHHSTTPSLATMSRAAHPFLLSPRVPPRMVAYPYAPLR
jgi:hypothetical protein